MIEIQCPRCKNKKLYELANGYKKCKQCHKKFSLKKILQEVEIIEAFCSNNNALQTSKRLNVNYRTVSNKYTLFRKLIAQYLEDIYQESHDETTSYEEHYYFTSRQKKCKEKSLYDAINIIGFFKNKKVYTLLMPVLQKSYDMKNDKEYERYLYWHKLQSKHAYKTPLHVFFAFLEQYLKKYKGVDNENFFYYLKECEFKYNFLINEQIEILKKLYFK